MSSSTGRSRYPLGLPAGSVRSILSIVVVGMVCALAIIPFEGHEELRRIPPNLVYLFFLILGSFFAAHGNSISKANSNEPSPLYLPRGFVRFLLVLALIATIGWSIYKDAPELNHWKEVLRQTMDKIVAEPWMPVYVLGGYFLGLFARMLFGGGTNKQNPTYQDFIAWVSLIAMLGLIGQILVDFVINPSVTTAEIIDTPVMEGIVAGIIAFYFAARS